MDILHPKLNIIAATIDEIVTIIVRESYIVGLGHSLRHGCFKIMVSKSFKIKQVATLDGGGIRLDKLKTNVIHNDHMYSLYFPTIAILVPITAPVSN